MNRFCRSLSEGETVLRSSPSEGGAPRRNARIQAFTLLEIVLAIALIALIATTIIGASARLLNARSVAPEDVFWQACAAARRAALRSSFETRLSWDDKAKAFNVNNPASGASFPVKGAGDDLGIDLLTGQAGASATLVGGTLMESSAAPSVSFFPDGTCVPFRVQIRFKGGARTLTVDPWTCARMLKPKDANGALP